MPRPPGFASIDRDAVDRFNLIDESITIATIEPSVVVEPKQMVATVKIIPFAVRSDALDACIAAVKDKTLFQVVPFKPHRTALIQTTLPGLKDSVLDKTVETTRDRLAEFGSTPRLGEALPARSGGAGAGDRRDGQSRRAARAGRRRFGDPRPPRRHPGRGHRPRRHDRAFRHAGRSRQSASHGTARRGAGPRPARLRPLAQGQRLRLGAMARPRRLAGRRRCDPAHGGRRVAVGDRLAAPTACPRRRPAGSRYAPNRRSAPRSPASSSPPAGPRAWAR